MSEQKVLCPWCGEEMTLIWDIEDSVHWFNCNFCGAHSPRFATRRPPNKPLTEEQLNARDDLDAVWEVYVLKNGATNVFLIPARTVKGCYVITNMGDIFLFGARPSLADIEAARAEKGGQT